ncbi:carbohydrate ABC transporter permease [Infirmifilum sp. NZ]|uniref:carbohydrate ABC transporter permease n=1 Tax=Infirmifilum sp. NZ TaxID=2926850 RepID=UPI00279CB458|nr:sugar ABC transporter permease [Infirmifilum sp. NZ]UNQ73275.1 sugar ABC transporter permease [Infirmifilum sp. NZ]
MTKSLNESIYKWLYALPTVALIFFIFIIPTIYEIWLSFHTKVIGGEPVFAGLYNYQRLISSEVFYKTILNTIIYSFTSVFAKAIIGLGAALLLNMRFRGRGFLRGFSILPWAFPSFVCAVLFWFNYDYRGTFNMILKALGLQPIHWMSYDNAMFSVILLNIWHGWPFFFMGYLAGLQAIPVDLYEAADIDGASPLQKFRSITLPMLKPVLLTVMLLSLMWTMGEFTQIYMTTGGGPIDATLTIPIQTYKIAFQTELNMPLAAAYSVLVLPIYLVLIYFTLRQMGE